MIKFFVFFFQNSNLYQISVPILITFVNGFKYYVLFIDHFTRFTWLYLLQSKSEVFDKFVHFKNLIEN